MSSLVIRRATAADIASAAALGAEIMRLHHGTNPQRFFMIDEVESGYAWWLTQELAREQAVILVAELAGSVVGYAYGAIEERDWAILADTHGALHDICVSSQARRKGVGRALMRAMIEQLEHLGAPQILLRAMVQNEAAQRLAQAMGFEPTMVEMTRPSSSTST